MKSKLYLLNDDVHSFDDVVFMLKKYLGYTLIHGCSIADITHRVGKCEIKTGDASQIDEIYEVFTKNGFKVEIKEYGNESI